MTKQARIKPGTNRVEPNLEVFMSKIEQQLIHLERKLDVVIAQNSAKPKETVVRPPDAVRPDHQQPHQRHERVMYKAVCADCSSPCEVPFKPTAERPVYCKECWSRRRAGGNRGNAPQRTPEEVKKALGSIKTSDLQKIAKGKKVKIKKPKVDKKKKAKK